MTSHKPRAAQPPVPDFQWIAELATKKAAERLDAANRQLGIASEAVLQTQSLLRPLIGSTAAESVAACQTLRIQLAVVQESLSKLERAAKLLATKRQPTMSEDAVLQELERDA